MNWNEIGTQVILSIAGVLISGIGVAFTYLINKFIKNDTAKRLAISLNELIQNSVLEIYQTYVQTLKDANIFDGNAQKIALERCLELVKANMPNDLKKWLETNYSDLDKYLKSLIEAQIGYLKNKAKGC